MQANDEYVLVDANGNEIPISREEALAAGGEGASYQKEVGGGQDGERGFGKYLLGAAAGGLAYHFISGMIKKKPSNRPGGYPPQQGGYPAQPQGYPQSMGQANYGVPVGYPPQQQYQQPVQYQPQQQQYPPPGAYGALASSAPMYPPPQVRPQAPQAGPGMASVQNPYQAQANPCTTQIANPYQNQNPYQNAGMPQGYPPAGYSGYPPQGYTKPF